ncbi:hypothetical protein F4818DRAFT_148662 [Hypoxylon cercidicola]|nr:hypothetical protein F4818DRAFT_148662 [Hypoxylon cercidicola]
MAQVAPGLGPEHNEPPCYNCGVRGHMFIACPEEPRKVPAGLEASWARQQSSTSPHNDSHIPNRRSKGPVITRYPPPPLPASSHHAPPMPHFDNSPPQPYQSGQLPVYPPPPSYSPGFGAHPPSQSPYDRYGPPAPPGPPGLPPGLPPAPPPSLNPPPYHTPYNAPYGPPPPVHGSYDHHHGPPPGPPGQYYPNEYPPGPNRPGQYPPSQYPPVPSYNAHHPYPSGPPPSYPPPPPHFVTPPAPYGYNGPPPGYPQGDYRPPHRGPPPSPYHQYPPSDPSRGQPHEDDRSRRHRGRDHQRRYDDRHSSETWHSQDAWRSPPPPVDQSYRDDYREDWHSRPSYRDDRPPRKRGHGRPMDERRRDRHDRFHPYKNSDKSDRHPRRRQQSVTTQSTPSRTAPPADAGTPVTAKADQDREPGEITSEPASDHGDPEIVPTAILDKDDEDRSWDEQTIFMDPPPTGQVDPIAAPLSTQYSEDVMIPPAFDAKALKSQYITPHNVDDFAQSVRETKDWQVMQHHPAFLDPVEICLEKLDDYKAAIQKDQAIRTNRRDRGINSHDPPRQRYGNSYGSGRHNGKIRDARYKPDQKKRRRNDFPDDADAYRSEKRHRDFPYDESFDKRHRPISPEPGEVVEADIEEPPYEPSETPMVPVGDTAWAPGPDVVKDTRSEALDVKDRSYGSDQNIPNQQPDILPLDILDRPKMHPPTPPTQPAITPPPYSRPSSRDSQRSRPNSRRPSFGSDKSGSSLDDIERELLGLGRPPSSGSDTERGSPKRFNDTTPKFKRRKQPVVEAYSRRW